MICLLFSKYQIYFLDVKLRKYKIVFQYFTKAGKLLTSHFFHNFNIIQASCLPPLLIQPLNTVTNFP